LHPLFGALALSFVFKSIKVMVISISTFYGLFMGEQSNKGGNVRCRPAVVFLSPASK